MAKLRRTFTIDLVTPEGVSESIEALSAVLPASDGQLGILPGRAPLAARLGAGPMKVVTTDNARKGYFVAGGFARMDEDVLTVMAEECVPVDRIDPDAAWEAIEQASAMPRETEAEVEMRDRALDVARVRFKLVQERRASSDKQQQD